jgi:hypothetical protein
VWSSRSASPMGSTPPSWRKNSYKRRCLCKAKPSRVSGTFGRSQGTFGQSHGTFGQSQGTFGRSQFGVIPLPPRGSADESPSF